MNNEELQRKARKLQKVIELSVRCLANLAYYRSGWKESTRLFDGDPYRLFNANCFGYVYLEWYKLFGSTDDEHHWRNIVADKEAFKSGLLINLGCNSGEYQSYWNDMVAVRDKVIAHQDYFDEMPTPNLENVLKSIKYLMEYIYNNEIVDGIELKHRYDPNEMYENFYRWGDMFWKGLDPTPEDRKTLVIRTVQLDDTR